MTPSPHVVGDGRAALAPVDLGELVTTSPRPGPLLAFFWAHTHLYDVARRRHDQQQQIAAVVALAKQFPRS